MTKTWPDTILLPSAQTLSARRASVNGRNRGTVYRLLNARDRGLPSGIKTITFRPLHHRNKTAIQRPARSNVFFIFEYRCTNSCKIGDAQSGGLGHLRPLDDQTGKVG